MAGTAAAAAILVWVSRRLVGRMAQGNWVADVVLSLLGAWMLYFVITWLPENGAGVGWVRNGLAVPTTGWDVLRAAATLTAAAAASVAIVSAVAHLVACARQLGLARPDAQERHGM